MQTALHPVAIVLTPPTALATGASPELPLTERQIAGLRAALNEHQVHPQGDLDFRGIPESALHA